MSMTPMGKPVRPDLLTVFNILFIGATATLAAMPALVLALWRGRGGATLGGLSESALWATLLFGWFAFALSVMRPSLFSDDLVSVPYGFLLTFVGGIGVGWILIAVHPTVRRRVLEIPLEWPVGLQTARLIGGAFIVWAMLGVASWPFALIAGLGDILVGTTAPFVARAIARRPARARGWVVAHALLGLADFVIAFSSAILTKADLPWPGQMIPAFLVPLAIVMHIWVLVALWRSRDRRAIHKEEPGLSRQPQT
ncbi:hypothetical protein [Brevundimonas aurifodinae]